MAVKYDILLSRLREAEEGIPGQPGAPGKDGKDGVTFTPSVSEDGQLTWTNDGNLDNPEEVNLKGEPGRDGAKGDQGEPGPANVLTIGEVEFVDSAEEGSVTIEGDSPAQTLKFKIPKGEKGADGQPGAAGADGKDAGFGTITATAESTDSETPEVSVTENGTAQEKTLAFTFKIPKGAKGEDGAAGQDGAQGPAGQDGKDAKIGTVTVNITPVETEEEAIGSAEVTDNESGAQDITFTLQLPKGDKGDPGAAGERGPAGQDGQPGKDAQIGELTAEVDMTTPEAEPTVEVTSTEESEAGKTFHFKFTLPKGEKGEQGEAGTPGTPGAEGAKGADGEPGKDGESAGFGKPEIEVETLESGTAEATVEATEESPNSAKIFKFHFKIPKGATGERGEAGPAGPAGPAGEAGTNGEKGETGANGADGKDAKIGSVTATAKTAENGEPKVTISTESKEDNTTDFTFTFEIPKGEKGDAGQNGEDGAQGPQGEAGQPGPQGPAGTDGAAGKDGQDGKDAPKHVLLFTCPESDNGLHLEVTYRELNNGGGEEETYQKLVNTTEESDRSKVKGNHGGLNWVECPEKGFGSVFGGWPVLVDLSQIEAIDVSKIYSIRYRWIANSGTGAAEPAMASEEAGTGTDGIASDWYAMIYPCATEAPVSSNPGAALPQIADMQENSVLFFSKGKYTALTIDELKMLINGTGTSS